jgi:hypothetical protein
VEVAQGKVRKESLMRFAILTLILAAACAAFGAEISNSGKRTSRIAETAKSISSAWEESGRPILALGETSHTQPYSITLLRKILILNARTLDFVALEADSTQQRIIDLCLLTGGPCPQLDGPGVRDPTVVDFIHRINNVRAAFDIEPIRVIAMDLPKQKEKSTGDWFVERPRYMAGILQRQIRGKRGILFGGAGHAATNSYKLPKLVGAQLGVALEYLPLGALLSSQNNVLAVYLSTPQSWKVTLASYFSRDIRPHFSLAKLLKDFPGQPIPTGNPDFQILETAAGSGGHTSMPISKNFDYWVLLNSKCEDLLL